MLGLGSHLLLQGREGEVDLPVSVGKMELGRGLPQVRK